MVFSSVFFNCYHYWLFIVGIFDFIVDCTFPGCCSMSPAFHYDLSGPHKHPSALSSTPNFFLLLFFAISFVFCFVLFSCCLLFFVIAVPWVLQILESVCYPQEFFTLHSFPTIGACTATTSFYQGFPGGYQFHFKSSRGPCFNGLTTCCEN